MLTSNASEICPPLLIAGPVSPSRASARPEYGYDADSDLEECEEDTLSSNGNATRTKGTGSPPKKASGTQSKFEAHYEFWHTRFNGHMYLAPATTPASAVMNLSDNDILSLDGFGSEAGLSEILQETNMNDATYSSRNPSLSLETNAEILSWRNVQEQRDSTPRDVSVHTILSLLDCE